MIKAMFKRDNSGSLVSFTITGHANAGEFGSDIVCASISVLGLSTLNGIEALAGVTPIIEIDEEAGGYLYGEVPKDLNREQMNIIQILLENLLLGVQAVREEYSEFIQVETIN